MWKLWYCIFQLKVFATLSLWLFKRRSSKVLQEECFVLSNLYLYLYLYIHIGKKNKNPYEGQVAISFLLGPERRKKEKSLQAELRKERRRVWVTQKETKQTNKQKHKQKKKIVTFNHKENFRWLGDGWKDSAAPWKAGCSHRALKTHRLNVLADNLRVCNDLWNRRTSLNSKIDSLQTGSLYTPWCFKTHFGRWLRENADEMLNQTENVSSESLVQARLAFSLHS